MEMLTVIGSIIVALFLYSVGAIVGFVYSCSREGRGWNDVGRAIWDSIEEAHLAKRRKNNIHLIRRRTHEN